MVKRSEPGELLHQDLNPHPYIEELASSAGLAGTQHPAVD
jgi:hypothetical protein